MSVLLAIASAIVSGVLLFINGSFVLAITTVAGASGVPYLDQPNLTQILLLTLPFLMLVFQWWMIDYVRQHAIDKHFGKSSEASAARPAARSMSPEPSTFEPTPAEPTSADASSVEPNTGTTSFAESSTP